MDREKVIKGLHDARRYLEDKKWSDRGASPHIDAINDALALLKEQEEEIENLKQTAQSMMEGVCLLKEQEAVEPTWQQGKAYCGSCGKRIPLKIGARFCHKCGKPILWEGR